MRNHERWIWTELIGFDSDQPDQGVAEYLETTGFVPDCICLLITSARSAGMSVRFLRRSGSPMKRKPARPLARPGGMSRQGKKREITRSTLFDHSTLDVGEPVSPVAPNGAPLGGKS